MMLIQHSVHPDWLFNTQSRVLQTDWFKLEINEKAFNLLDWPVRQFLEYYPTITTGLVSLFLLDRD